jgi:antitoxin (DNA-binding transcriptional repressor) of toxin-antitoxin stability system
MRADVVQPFVLAAKDVLEAELGGEVGRGSVKVEQGDFAEVLNRVRYQGETILVERGGEEVCEIIPPAQPRKFTWEDLAQLIEAAGSAGEEWATAVESGIRDQPPAEFKKWPR